MKFNGVNPCSLHEGISIAKEIPPGTAASQLETISGSTGEVVVGRTIKQAEYIVRINIAGKSRAEAWEMRKLIAAWARGEDTQTCQLIPSHWPDVHYDAILKEISPPEFVFGFGVIEIVFAIPRPIALSNAIRSSIGSGEAAKQLLTADGKQFITSQGQALYVMPDDDLIEEGNAINLPTIDGSSYARPMFKVVCKGSEGLNLYVDGVKMLSLTGIFETGEKVDVSTIIPRVRLYTQEGVWTDVNDRVDYTKTDFQALAEAFSPGMHVVYCPESSQLDMTWRDEWI